jgi:nicotinate-nucleotide--dimethylbenzimidazole phosphoribosyltransferase
MSIERPRLPPGFDDSRASERRRRPDAGRFNEAAREGVWEAIAKRRDIRRFRGDPLPAGLLERLIAAAHQAPSVGLMQPWRFIVIREEPTKAAMQALVARERLVQADHLDRRARHFLDLKIEGIREAPVSICVCCDREPGREVLGRHTIRDTDLYSTCLAIENLWLAARAEGVGVGWVSFYKEEDVRALLGIPPHAVPVAWLCVGYPDERPLRPGLEASGWERRHPLEAHVFNERWGAPATAGSAPRISSRRQRASPWRAPAAVVAGARRRGSPGRRERCDPRARRLRRARQAGREPGHARDPARALGDRDRKPAADRSRHRDPRARGRPRRLGAAREPLPGAGRRPGRSGRGPR